MFSSFCPSGTFFALPTAKANHRLRYLLKSPSQQTGFSLYYQPIWQISSQRFTRCEALMRLCDPILGTVPPERFISLAEMHGHIMNLGQFALEESCRFLCHLKERNLALTVHVNLSPLQLRQSSFHEILIQTIHKAGADPRQLELELTESAAAASIGQLRLAMEQIHKSGITFSLDDFGAGYSGLRYLASLPLSTIKLDKAFIQPLPHSQPYVSLVKNLIRTIHELGFAVIAEGVEQPEQYHLLTTLECDYLQGFLLARPMCESDLISFLQHMPTTFP